MLPHLATIGYLLGRQRLAQDIEHLLGHTLDKQRRYGRALDKPFPCPLRRILGAGFMTRDVRAIVGDFQLNDINVPLRLNEYFKTKFEIGKGAWLATEKHKFFSSRRGSTGPITC